MLFEVVGAGFGPANGVYSPNWETSNEKPVFANSNGVFLSFKPLTSSVAPGWGIRKEKANNSLYYDGVDSDVPGTVRQDAAWKWKCVDAVAPAPAPTVRALRVKKRCGVIDTQERAWKQRKFSDAEIVCAGVRVAVHRSTLAAASAVFDAAFSSAMAEGRSAIYEIKEVSPAAVEAMLCYIYTGVLESQGTDLAALFDLSVQYELHGLCEEVALELPRGVSVDNVRECMAMLKRHSQNDHAKNALEAILKIVKKNGNEDLILALV